MRASPARTPASAAPNPDFVLNQPRYPGASILLARNNFGCGSSREHAPWARSTQYGFRAIIAPSFADIFFNNCFKNGLLPMVLTDAAGRSPVRRDQRVPRLPADHRPRSEQVVVTARTADSYPFDVDAVPQVLPAERLRRHRR